MADPITNAIQKGTKCFSPTMTFPGLTEPGLPNFLMGTMLSTMGGIGFVLNYIPPNPTNIPSPPGIDLFLQPFLGAVKLPSSHAGFSMGPISIPAAGSGKPAFDPSGLFKMAFCCVMLPFNLITALVTSIISLSPSLPTPDLGIKVFKELTAQAGLPPGLKVECIPLSVVGLMTSLIPL